MINDMEPSALRFTAHPIVEQGSGGKFLSAVILPMSIISAFSGALPEVPSGRSQGPRLSL